jgi:DNA-binding beta-propeller fold protein YncE
MPRGCFRIASAVTVASAMSLWALTAPGARTAGPGAPLRLVADVGLPGAPVRFDYQSLDATTGRLYISHMNADQLVVFDTRTRRVVANLDGFPRVRGVRVVPELERVYAAARGSNEVVVVDTRSLRTIARVGPVHDPDGIAYASKAGLVFVSDQGGRADVVIDPKKNAVVQSIPVGGEAGNTVYDATSDRILVAVAEPPALALIDPATREVTARLPLPGLKEAHGIALDAAHRVAFVAGEGNHTLAVFDLDARRVLATHPVGDGPDVLALDPGLGILYVAAESGTVSVFACRRKELESRGQLTTPHAHTICVDPVSHLVYLPLQDVGGRPVLRIMEPAGE